MPRHFMSTFLTPGAGSPPVKQVLSNPAYLSPQFSVYSTEMLILIDFLHLLTNIFSRFYYFNHVFSTLSFFLV